MGGRLTVGLIPLEDDIGVRIPAPQPKMNLPPTKTDKLAQQVAVKSAVNPSLWACVVISIPLFILATRTNGWISVGFFIVALIPVGVFAFSYLYLLFKNPEYLRSEEYQLRMSSMRLLGDKDNPLHAEAEDIISVVNNPKLPPPKAQ